MATRVYSVDRGEGQIARAAMINAPVTELFGLVVKPENHAKLDGRGTVHQFRNTPERLSTGDTMSARMTLKGIPYWLTSNVVEVTENEAVAWRHPAGHIWRWEFKPIDPTRTLVTEIWDYREIKGRWLHERLGVMKQNARALESTLERLSSRYS